MISSFIYLPTVLKSNMLIDTVEIVLSLKVGLFLKALKASYRSYWIANFVGSHAGCLEDNQ